MNNLQSLKNDSTSISISISISSDSDWDKLPLTYNESSSKLTFDIYNQNGFESNVNECFLNQWQNLKVSKILFQLQIYVHSPDSVPDGASGTVYFLRGRGNYEYKWRVN